MWAEKYVVPVPYDAAPQTVTDLLAGLYDPASNTTIQPTTGITPIIGKLAIAGETHPLPAPRYRFGDAIALLDSPTVRYHSLEELSKLELCFAWGALAATPINYSVFVHVL